MWYYGTLSCSHEGRVNIIGKSSERQRKADWYFAHSICEECRQKAFEKEKEEAAQKAKDFDFPVLSGTEKQVEWANAIRVSFYEYFQSKNISVDDVITKEQDARFWIDNRGDLSKTSFLKNYRTKEIKRKINQQLVDIDTVRPSEIKHDGVVEIVHKENNICLYYERDSDFIELVKSYRYLWNEKVWCRELSETTGAYIDRAAEIGRALLKNGFCISIHDEEIKEKAISGAYKKEQTRWIDSKPDTPLLAINWNGWNNDLYEKASKIKGAKWSSPNVVVDVSHWKSVEKFATENEFCFTKAAQEKIETYKKQLEEAKEAKNV